MNNSSWYAVCDKHLCAYIENGTYFSLPLFAWQKDFLKSYKSFSIFLNHISFSLILSIFFMFLLMWLFLFLYVFSFFINYILFILLPILCIVLVFTFSFHFFHIIVFFLNFVFCLSKNENVTFIYYPLSQNHPCNPSRCILPWSPHYLNFVINQRMHCGNVSSETFATFISWENCGQQKVQIWIIYFFFNLEFIFVSSEL